jgi:N-acetyl-1-D-myo-inositol-2-amino-2-deoxy-alpha-D-glucopyranoside deacetylase
MADRRILFVHAHPDDESIGSGVTMARYVAEGAHVTLITCTLGEQGEVLIPELAHLAADRDDNLAPTRLAELDAAMALLGVTDYRRLGGDFAYRDSGMIWHESGLATAGDEIDPRSFWAADLTQAATDLVEVIREVRPQVLVTYDEIGNYGHPDHIQAHRVAMYAAQLAAASSYRRDLGEAWDIAKIYWTAMSASFARSGLAALRDSGLDTGDFGFDPDNLPPIFCEDVDIDARIESPAHIQAKLAAMKAHATQITPDGTFFAMGMDLAALQWASEYHRLVNGNRGPVGDDGFEHDLFAGLGV